MSGRKRSGATQALLLIPLITYQFTNTNAFTLNLNRSAIRLSNGILYAKVPPKSIFDLDAIFALEAELDLQDKIKNQVQEIEEEIEEEEEWDVEYDGLKTYTVTADMVTMRIDAILSEMEPDLSRSECGSLISGGMVAVLTPSEEAAGQKPTVTKRKSLKLEEGSILQVKHAVVESPTEIVAQKLPLSILYEDEHMIVLNKAAGMVVHPAVGNWDGTVVNALAYYLANESPYGSGEFIEADGTVKAIPVEGEDVYENNGEAVAFRPGIVHRLDKGTTGILVVAKTRESLTALSASFANRQVRKTYVAMTGTLRKDIVDCCLLI